MNKSSLSRIVLGAALAFGLTAEALAAHPVVIRGRITGCEGNALRMSHARLQALPLSADNAPLATVQAGADGRFEISAMAEGKVLLTLYGPHHKPVDIVLNLDDNTPVDVDVQLGTPLRDDRGFVRAFGSFNETNPFNGPNMFALGKRKYAVQVPEEGRVTYQIVGLYGEFCVAGTAGDLVFAPGNHPSDGYFAAVTSDGSAKLDFDANQLPPSGRKAVVRFTNPANEKKATVLASIQP